MAKSQSSLQRSIFRTANEKPLELEKAIPLHVRIGDLEVPVWFVVVDELAIEILAEKSFRNLYVRSFFLYDE